MTKRIPIEDKDFLVSQIEKGTKTYYVADAVWSSNLQRGKRMTSEEADMLINILTGYGKWLTDHWTKESHA